MTRVEKTMSLVTSLAMSLVTGRRRGRGSFQGTSSYLDIGTGEGRWRWGGQVSSEDDPVSATGINNVINTAVGVSEWSATGRKLRCAHPNQKAIVLQNQKNRKPSRSLQTGTAGGVSVQTQINGKSAGKQENPVEKQNQSLQKVLRVSTEIYRCGQAYRNLPKISRSQRNEENATENTEGAADWCCVVGSPHTLLTG